MKYEDIVYNKENTLIKIVSFFEKIYNFKFKDIDIKIENIIKSTEFSYMEKLENKIGFNEIVARKFFHSGKKGQWKNILSLDQIKIIENAFYKEMIYYNYL